MKIRQGFVSNSSSSSFCILGVCVDSDEYTEAYEEIADNSWSWSNKDTPYKLNYSSGIEEYYECHIFGLEPNNMKDDETLLQFKQRIVDEFKKAGINIKVDELYWYTDGGRDE